MKILLLLTLLTCFFVSRAQLPPEKQLQTTTTDTGKLTLLRQLAIKNRQENMDLSMRYATEGLALAHKTGIPVRIAAFYSVLANNYLQAAVYTKAKLYLDSSYRLFKKLEDRKGLANVLSGLGSVCQRQSDLVNAVRYFMASYEMAKSIGDEKGMFLGTYNIAIAYCDQQDGPKSLEYAQKAYDMVQKNKDEKHLGISLATLAEAYRLNADTAKAEHYFAAAQQEFERTGDDYGIALVFTNRSLIQADRQKEMTYELRAQEYWDKSGTEDLMVVANLGNLGASYYDLYQNDITKGQYGDKKTLLQKAEACILRSVAMARKIGSNGYQPGPLKTLAGIQYLKGDYKGAYGNLKIAAHLDDSLFSQENKNKIAALESQQKINLRDKEIHMGKAALLAQKKQKIALVAVVLLLALVGFMFFRQARSRQKVNAQLLLLNAELDEANRLKATFFGILSHDLRSPVARLVNYLRLQKESPDMLDEEMQVQYAGRIRVSAENLLDTMESILIWSKGQMQHFTPQPEQLPVDHLFEDIHKHFEGIPDLNLVLHNPEQLTLHADPEFVKTIMRNLTDNAVKCSTEPLIVWTAGKRAGRLYLSVQDNGPGAKQEQLEALFDEKTAVVARNGLGFHLVRDLAKAIGCTIEVALKEGEGTTFYLVF